MGPVAKIAFAILRAAPGIVEALKNKDQKLAERRILEAARSQVQAAIARERMKAKKRANRD